jgi:acyl carrier protein
MPQGEIIARLQLIFDDLFMEKVALTPEVSADDIEEWDSLTQISLVLAIEKRFHIRFRVGEAAGVKSIGQLADLIVQHLDGRTPDSPAR